jgi:RNA polymerase sigma-70 factor (ECF subfamily)
LEKYFPPHPQKAMMAPARRERLINNVPLSPARRSHREAAMSHEHPTERINRGDEVARLPDAGEWVERYGDYLYRFALLRVGSPQDAEDLVQDALLAGFRARGQFAGRAQARSWLVAILKRKIIDRRRAQDRHDQARAAAEEDLLGQLFTGRGHWRVKPGAWPGDPAAEAERAEFWQVLRRCLGRLPPRTARAFCLREIDALSNHEVRQALHVTPSNLWVLLHRARLGLSRCLDRHWFGAARRK